MKSLSLRFLRVFALALMLSYTNMEARTSVPEHWIYLGNELEDVVDPETGKTIRYLTSGESVDFHFHYHGQSWGVINGDTYLFLTSFRQRPSQAGSHIEGERQILAANVDSGDLFYLTTIPNEGRGGADQWSHRQYECDYYAPRKEIFFFDKKRQKIYIYDCINGKTELLLTLPQGGIGRQLNVGGDAKVTRVIYAYTMNSGTDRAREIVEYIDIDEHHNKLDGNRLAETGENEAINHLELRPGNKDYFFYKYRRDMKNGNHQDIKAYMSNVRNPDLRVVINPNNDTIDHIVWGGSGNHVFYDDNRGNLIRFNVETKKHDVLGSGIKAIHNKLSSDERLWLYDSAIIHPGWQGSVWETQVPNGRKVVNYVGAINIYNIETGKDEKYANIIWGHPHPRHPHAIFSHDDSMISFVTGASDSINTRLAVMKVDND